LSPRSPRAASSRRCDAGCWWTRRRGSPRACASAREGADTRSGLMRARAATPSMRQRWRERGHAQRRDTGPRRCAEHVPALGRTRTRAAARYGPAPPRRACASAGENADTRSGAIRARAPRSSVHRRIVIDPRCHPHDRPPIHHPAWESISLVTGSVSLRCALTCCLVYEAIAASPPGDEQHYMRACRLSTSFRQGARLGDTTAGNGLAGQRSPACLSAQETGRGIGGQASKALPLYSLAYLLLTYRTRLVVGQKSGRMVHSRLGNGLRFANGMPGCSACKEMHCTSVSRLSNNLRRGRVMSDVRGR